MNPVKEKLRKKYKKIRDAIPVLVRKKAARKIAAKLFQLKEFKLAKNIALYSSIGSEVLTEPIFKRAKQLKKKVFYPRMVTSLASLIPAPYVSCPSGVSRASSFYALDSRQRLCGNDKRFRTSRNDNQIGKLSFFQVKNLKTDLVPGAYGILQPIPTLEKISADKLDLILVPGVAFDKKGYRLGYGKGYYDRVLKKNPALFSVGLCYDKTFVSSLPRDAHDHSVQCLITEKEIFRPSYFV